MKKNNRNFYIIVTLIASVFILGILIYYSSPIYSNLQFKFDPKIFQSAEVKVRSRGKIFVTYLSNVELREGKFVLPGAELLYFKGEVFNLPKFNTQLIGKNCILTLKLKVGDRKTLEYIGPSVKIEPVKSTLFYHYISCCLSTFLVILSLSISYFLVTKCKIKLKTYLVCAFVFFWMIYHLLINWPGIIGFDGVLNYFDASSLNFSSFIQPLTTLLYSAELNIWPHYSWNSFITIFLMVASFGIITHYLTSNKKLLMLFMVILFYFIYSPLNVFTNIFISRDSVFSWIFFITLIMPVVLKVSDYKGRASTWGYSFFLFFFFVSLEIRKEIIVLSPLVIFWSYIHLDLLKMQKIIIFSLFSSLIFFSFWGTKELTDLNLAPIYQATILINPIANIISKEGLNVINSEEKIELLKFVDLKNFSKDYRPEDINPYPFKALNGGMTQRDLGVLAKLYFRLLLKYPKLWFENRFTIIFGSFGLNTLSPNYAVADYSESGLPKEFFYTTHTMPYYKYNLNYPYFLKKWLVYHWENKSSLNWNRYIFLSFLIPILVSLVCLPFLKNTPATLFAFILNLGRLIAIFPIMPSSYIKYSYSSYLLFLFLPLLLLAELNANKENV